MATNAFAAAATKARAANEERYKQGMSLWDQIIQRYQPGGGFGAGAEASYERGKTQAIGAGMQQLVSSGLANTTVAATMGKKYEEEVGTPFRAQLEDMRMGRLSGAQEGKAGFIERREDVGPSGQLAMQSGYQAGMAQGAQARGDKGPSPWDEDFLGGGWGVSTPWGKNYTPRSSSGSTGVSGGGGGGGTGRKNTPFTSSYNPAGLNMEQFGPQPTYGEPGGPAGPPAPEGYTPGGAASLNPATGRPFGTLEHGTWRKKGGKWVKDSAAPTGIAGMKQAMEKTIGMGWG